MIAKTITTVTIVVCFFISVVAQNDDRWLIVDEFGRATNDELMSRVDHFHQVLDKRDDAIGLVILYGPRTTQYLNQRRIDGCTKWRERPPNRFKFVFSQEEHPIHVQVRFYLVAKDVKIAIDPPDYKLPDLRKPIELNKAIATDEYCPTYFDVEWFSHFMSANPTFRGKVIIDSSKNEFVRRVGKYRGQLANFGIASSKVKFIRHHFMHERDEQWWLIPQKS